MTDARARRASSSAPGRRGPRYRRHELALPDGGKLRLGVDGTIERLDAGGSTLRSWPTDDLDWAGQAIRFGLRPQPPTVTPHGQRIPPTRLPGA